jgi:competence ComEA-like helix-hairpin-helix protein
MTTQVKYGFMYPQTESTGKTSYVKCNEIQSVPKDDLDKYVCTLTEAEMEAVDRAMMVALGLNNSTDNAENDEIAKLHEKIASLEDELDEIIIQRDIWKRMYGKAIDKIADKQSEPPAPAPKPVEVVAEEVVVEEEEPSLVDLNTCSESDLRKCGCSVTIAKDIIARRPYTKVCELKLVPQLTRMGYKLLEKQVCVNEVPVKEEPPKVEKVEKVNINTATAKELQEFLGICENFAWAITGYRKRKGKYDSVEELRNTRLPKNFVEHYGDKLTV